MCAAAHAGRTHAVIKQLGFSGLRAFVLASTFSSVDRNAPRKPNRFIPISVSGNASISNTNILPDSMKSCLFGLLIIYLHDD